MTFKRVFFLVLTVFILSVLSLNTVSAEDDGDKKNEDNKILDQGETVKDKSNEGKPENESIPAPPKDDSIVGDEGKSKEVEVNIPDSVTGEKQEGTGTVVDFSTTGARAFYTIKDNDDNTFYLMIDMDKAENNVYFLSDVEQSELAGDSDGSNDKSSGFLGNSDENTKSEKVSNESDSNNPESKEESDEEDSGNFGFLITVALVALLGAFAYYFFVVKKKKEDQLTEEAKDSAEDDEEDDNEGMTDTYQDEDMSDDDSPEENEESHDEDEGSNNR